MTESRFASIDIGSNSVKLLVAERRENRIFFPVSETVYITRLGEGFLAHRLGEPAIRRTLDAIREFSRICAESNVTGIAAVGTSALREASNQQEFIARASEAGILIEAISGQEEARLSYIAVRHDKLWKDAVNLYVVDIGGGSTEIIHGIGMGDLPASRISLPLGAVRLTEAALRSDPPAIAQLAQAVLSVDETLHAVSPLCGSFAPVGAD